MGESYPNIDKSLPLDLISANANLQHSTIKEIIVGNEPYNYSGKYKQTCNMPSQACESPVRNVQGFVKGEELFSNFDLTSFIQFPEKTKN